MNIIKSQYFDGDAPHWAKTSPARTREPEDVEAIAWHQVDVPGGFGVSDQALERHGGDYDAALFERFEGSEFLRQQELDNGKDGDVGEPYHYVYRPQERRILAIHHPSRYTWHGHGLNAKSIGVAVDGQYPGDELETAGLAFAASSIIEHAFGLGFTPRYCDHHRQGSSGRGGDAGEEIARIVEGVGLPFGITVRPDYTQGSGKTIPESWRFALASSPSNCSHPTLNIPKMPSGTYNKHVASLQGQLLTLRYGPEGLVSDDGQADGKPGTGTELELLDFQSVAGLVEDAICGPATWAALFS